MDRIIVYPGAIPLDTDMLNTNATRCWRCMR